MRLFGKSKKEREKEYMNKLDVPSCLKENSLEHFTAEDAVIG